METVLKQKHIARNKSAQTGSEVSRCAVCKIDLKGRFVYVDSYAQELLGFSDVDLFGKPLASVVEESQHPVLSRLTSTPNHYESFFESTVLTLISSSGEHIQVTVIFSLNFIAGSPANYQLIISKLSSHDTPQESIEPDHNLTGDFLQRLATISSKPDWSVLVTMLSELTSAQIVVVYSIIAKKLTPIKACSPTMTDEDALNRVPKAKGLSKRVAFTGETYDFTNEKSVREAIEADSSAPNELIMRIDLSDSEKYLVRLIYDADDTDLHVNAQTKASQALVKLVARLAGCEQSQPVRTDSDHICGLLIEAAEELSPGFTFKWANSQKSGQDSERQA